MAAVDVEEVPQWRVKTTLQRTVQALKRHRDIYFQHRVEHRPTSIIITTLAAQCYSYDRTLYDILTRVTQRQASLTFVMVSLGSQSGATGGELR